MDNILHGLPGVICYIDEITGKDDKEHLQHLAAVLNRLEKRLDFGVHKFHQYLYERKFTLITDHKHLAAIFGSKKGILSLTAVCLQRWTLLLSGYDHSISFKTTETHRNPNGLSRLPLNDQEAVGEMKAARSLSDSSFASHL